MKISFFYEADCLTVYLFALFSLLSGCAEEEIAPTFTMETEEEIILESSAESEGTISFTSTREWKATTTEEWLDVSPSSGDAGTYEITLTATSGNNSHVARTAVVTLTSVTLVQSFTVEQLAADYVELEEDTFHIMAEGGTLSIPFTTNVDDDELSVYGSSSNWLTQSARTRSAVSYIINLTVQPNTDGNSRTAYVFFYKGSGREGILLNTATIVQEGVVSGESVDYTEDGNVRVLQEATEGNGLPVVLMGDGFIDTEITNGTYDRVMEKAMENLFSEEPLKSLRHHFNVYAITAVSRHNSFGSGYETVFNCELEGGSSTGISGDDEKIQEYVSLVPGIDLAQALVVVILNSSAYAGTTYFGYSDGAGVVEFAIAYCPVIYNLESESFRQVLVHEAVGHGFAKLEDEYSYRENGSIPASDVKIVQYMQTLGWARNVDFTTDTDKVLWSAFLNDSRYSSEGVGIYEGACTYMTEVYRPTEESMMNSNTTGFNAPSREAIYDAVMRRGSGRTPTYEEFVTFDQPLQQQSRNTVRITTLTQEGRPFARPRFVNQTLSQKWNDRKD